MKKIVAIILCVYAGITAYAQTSDAEAEAIINLLGVQKKEAIAKLVNVDGKDSAAFWKLYEEYQQKNMVTAKNRLRLYEQTARSYGSMEPKVADSLAKLYFSNRGEQEKALEEYYAKIKKATNAVIAFEFFQAEVYLLTQVRASIMQQIPTYGQFQAAMKKKE